MFHFKRFYTQLITVFLFSVVVVTLSNSSVAKAAPTVPNPGDFTDRTRLLVGKSSGGVGIEALTSIVKIYSVSPTITVNIRGFGQCNGDGFDYLNPGQTTYRVYRTLPDETRTGSPLTSRPNGGVCNGYTNNVDYTFSVTHPGSPSQLPGHTNLYVFEFVATLAGSSLGFNAFRVNVPGGDVGFSRTSGTDFAIKSDFNENFPTYSEFNIKFAPSCDFVTPANRLLEWFDADQGEPNQLETISFDLIDETTGTTIINNYSAVGGQNEARNRSVTFEPGHRYNWRWQNVSSYNGVQFQLPFDSIYYETVCTPPPPPTSNVECIDNAFLTPAEPSANESFTVRVRVSYDGGTPSRPTYTMQVNITSTFPYSPYSESDADYSAVNGIASFTTPDPPLKRRAGTYTVTWRFTGPGVDSGQCSDTITITDKPYFRVYGGDVLAGSGFGSSCSTTPDATIIGWNRGNLPANSDFPASSPYGGAGVQLAAFALGAINDFASATTRGSLPRPPKGLSFANTAGTGTYGGTWDSDNVTCASDYFALASEAPNGCPPGDPVNLNSLNGGYSCPTGTNLRIGNSPVNKGSKITIFVDGNVAITGPIFVNGGATYANINEIPSVRIIARNIYIAPGANSIDAVLIAQPDGNAGGTIYTCSDGGFGEPNKSQMINACRTKLTVNGAMIAQRFRFFRTLGSFMPGNNIEPATSSNIAEVIQYNPEVWLTSPAVQAPIRNPNQTYTSQPPIL